MMARSVGRGRTEDRRLQFLLGIVSSLLVVACIAAAGVIYFAPLGEKIYRVRQYVASGLSSGDVVRVAGIDVGNVKSVMLENDHVLVKFTVRKDILVGNLSSTEVKLLTPIGGHYLALQLKGSQSLGDNAIPVERSHSPYDEFGGNVTGNPTNQRKPWEVLDLTGTAAPFAQKINVGNLREILSLVSQALDDQPDAVRVALDSFAEILDTLVSREEQIHQGVNLAHEYLHEFGMERELLRGTLARLAKVAVALKRWKQRFPEMMDKLRYLMEFGQGPSFAIENHLTGPVGDLEDLIENMFRHPDNPWDIINQIIDSVFHGVGVISDNEPRRVGPENRNACERAGEEEC